ncbi:MAG TPA: hypothetical protein PLL76_21480 [Thermoanaerobaculia bacterium]|nr:hypothetical protein [Thermoanaerobaculia bacterium]HQP88835.1 hypothetical protein [Thermoanaerobaculia bacterium]
MELIGARAVLAASVVFGVVTGFEAVAAVLERITLSSKRLVQWVSC